MPASHAATRRAEAIDVNQGDPFMKLYYAPGACSLATHIALLDAGFDFELERVDLKHKTTEGGKDFRAVNSKGYVPALVLGDGETLTESLAVLDWITTQFPALGLEGERGRTRMLEMLGFLATEIHKGFGPLWHAASPEAKADAEIQLIARMEWLAQRLRGRYLFGDQPTVADYYLFVMLRWALNFGIAVPQALQTLLSRVGARPNVLAAIDVEESPTNLAAVL
jgi:glutathione S-transferase